MTTPAPRKQRKMVNIDIEETSGVDHPAHLVEGWVVAKSASAEDVNKLFGLPDATNEEAQVAITEEDLKKAVDEAVEKATKTVQEKLDEANAKIAELEKAPAKKEADSPEDLEKAALAGLPESVRKQMDEDRAELAKAREEVAKERDARLDRDAVEASKSMFKAVALDHTTVAPALRRVEVIDADLAKSIKETLSAADAQLATAGIFSEFGKSTQTTDTASSKMEGIAKSLQEATPGLTHEQAVVKALELNPELYSEIEAEKAGK